MCTIGKTSEILADEDESQIIGVRGENCVSRCQAHVTPEAVITRTRSQNNTTYSIDRSSAVMGFESDTRTNTSTTRQHEIGTRW
ncbi:unnamed protein product [Rotaria sordida]|uniref:Uncharacterized protein n=1 Tax=Rotaria sordida TaxID=392033 RepID=A0A815KFN9_9BILA|nr:unnamed protein product [Rotaria sordida]CAF1620940.1 unnamed protein product [Rotaria sordida]